MTPTFDQIRDDIEFYTDGEEAYFEIHSKSGGTLYVENPDDKPLPKAGDEVRYYGRGFGYPVRGVVLVTNEIVYRYITAEQEQVRHKKWCAEQEAERLNAWTERAEETALRIQALPEPLQVRMRFFLRNADWGQSFGFYELTTCEAAVRILNGEGPDAEAGLSGNMVSCAQGLAKIHARDPELVPRLHGAMCPVVGCERYGCFSTISNVEELSFFGKRVDPISVTELLGRKT